MKSQIAIILFFSLVSCQNSKNYKYQISESDSISINIDDYVMPASESIDFFRDSSGNHMLYLTNNVETKRNEILLFNLDSKILEKKILFSGSNGLKNTVHGFNYIGKDSLVISTIFSDTLYITDLNSKILKKAPYHFENDKQVVSRVVSRSDHPIISAKNKLYFSPSVPYNSKHDLYDKSFFFSFDLETNKTHDLKFGLPKQYIDSDTFSPDLAYCFDGKNIIYSPKNSHEIWINNLSDGTVKIKDTKSDYFKEFLKYSEKELTIQEKMFNDSFYSQYTNIIYDKYRKVYYRLFYPGVKIDKNSTMLAKQSSNIQNFSIIVLDENFNKISEKLYENYRFCIFSYFVTPNGLYFNSNNPLNKNYRKNQLKFTKIILKNEDN